MLQYGQIMSSQDDQRQETREVKEGWLRRNIVSLLVICLLVALVASLFLFAYRYPEKVAAFENYGYLGAFLIALIANATIILPFPGFVVLFALGAAFNPLFIGLVSGLGGAIGEMSCYLLGYSGRGVASNRKLYDKAVQWLEKWGALTVFIFALTPLPFDVLGVAAGFLRFTFWKFFIACFLGKTLLYIAMALAGAWGWEVFVDSGFGWSPVLVSVIAVLGVSILVVLARYLRNRMWKRRHKTDDFLR